MFGPSWWVKKTMRRYATPIDRYPLSGAETARRLLDGCGLGHVTVGQTDQGDHYDPQKKAVQLSENNFADRSLTAITVAGHEVGHALQDRDNYPPFTMRGRVVKLATSAQKAAQVLFVLLPVAMLLTRIPAVGAFMLMASLGSLFLSTAVHLVTLPVETDASFKRALPLLRESGILQPRDREAARHILRAAAYTYVAGSLLSLASLWRWLRVR